MIIGEAIEKNVNSWISQTRVRMGQPTQWIPLLKRKRSFQKFPVCLLIDCAEIFKKIVSKALWVQIGDEGLSKTVHAQGMAFCAYLSLIST
jgi:hypothetical protein